MLFDTNRPEWQPLINPVSNLVYGATGNSVRDVFVMGGSRWWPAGMGQIDEAKLFAEVPVAVARFGKRLKFQKRR